MPLRFIMNSVAEQIYTSHGTLLLAFVTSMVVCFLMTPVVIKVANLKHLMDEPNARSSHTQKTATLGGLSIFASILIGFTIWCNFNQLPGLSLQYLISSLVILFFIGLKDDILDLSPYSKLIAQILAALIVVYGANLRIESLFGLFGIQEISTTLSIIITVFVFIIIINSYNLIDGIDGLAASIGIVAAISFGFWFYLVDSFQLAILASTLVGALVGFLRYNFSEKEKIFMGDTGSMIVGFVLAVFSIKFIQMNQEPTINYWVPNAPIVAITILIIPLFDTLRVFLLRILNGRPPFYPDRTHIHHLLIDRKISHLAASSILFVANIILVFVAFRWLRDTDTTWTSVGFISLFVFYAYILRNGSKTANFVENSDSNNENKSISIPIQTPNKKLQVEN